MNTSKILKDGLKRLQKAPDFHRDSFDAGVMLGFLIGFDKGFMFGAGYTVICMLVVAGFLWLIG